MNLNLELSLKIKIWKIWKKYDENYENYENKGNYGNWRLEMSIFLTGRDQSFTYTYVYAGDWSFYGSSCGLEINILWYILGSERLIFSINNLIIKRFFKKKDKWLWNISHSFAIFDIDLLQPVYYSMEINLFQPFDNQQDRSNHLTQISSINGSRRLRSLQTRSGQGSKHSDCI